MFLAVLFNKAFVVYKGNNCKKIGFNSLNQIQYWINKIMQYANSSYHQHPNSTSRRVSFHVLLPKIKRHSQLLRQLGLGLNMSPSSQAQGPLAWPQGRQARHWPSQLGFEGSQLGIRASQLHLEVSHKGLRSSKLDLRVHQLELRAAHNLKLSFTRNNPFYLFIFTAKAN